MPAGRAPVAPVEAARSGGLLIVMVSVIGLGLIAGCGSRQTGPRGVRSEPTAQWPFKPRTMRIHPLTHIEPGPSGAVLEAWVQLQDRDGFPVRGLGTLALTLDSSGVGDMQHTSWTIQLESADQGNQPRFDPITSSYYLPLSLSGDAVPPQARLRATLHTPDGDRFVSRLALPEPVN